MTEGGLYYWVPVMVAMVASFLGAMVRGVLGVAILIASLPVFALGRRCFPDDEMPFLTFETITVFLVWLAGWRMVRMRGISKREYDPAITLSIVMFVLASILSSFLSQNVMLSFRILIAGGIAPLMVFWVVRQADLGEKEVKVLIYGIMAACAQISLYTLIRYNMMESRIVGVGLEEMTREIYNESPVANLFGPPSASMSVVVAAIPLAMTLVIKERGWLMVSAFTVLVCACIAVTLSLSRGSWLGMLVAVVVGGFSLRDKMNWRILLLVIVVPLGIYGLGIWDFIYAGFSLRVNDSGMFESTARVENNHLALISATQFLWHGLGLGSYQDIYGYFSETRWAYIPHLAFAHSLLLTLIPEIGLLGALSFAGFLVLINKRAFNENLRFGKMADMRPACIAGVAAYLTVASLGGCHLVAYLGSTSEECYLMAPAMIVVFALLGLMDNLTRQACCPLMPKANNGDLSRTFKGV